MTHHRSTRALIFFAALCLLACGCNPEKSAKQSALRVVTSITPLGHLVRAIGGKRVDVVVVVPPGSNPHTFDLTPEVLRNTRDARLLVQVGAGFEYWSDKLRANIHSDQFEIVSMLEPAMPWRIDGREAPRVAASESEGDDVHENPHFWLDPVRMIEAAQRVRTALIRVDPSHAVEYNDNAARFITSLRELDREIARETAGWRMRGYIAQHASWEYFAFRYGLTQEGLIERSPGREATPKELAELLRVMARSGAGVIFAETVSSTKAADALAQESGARVVLLDPVGSPDFGATYEEWLRTNVRRMADVMR